MSVSPQKPLSPSTENAVGEVTYGPGLSKVQTQQLKELVQQNTDVFSSKPGCTTVIKHHIWTEPGKKVKLRPYRTPEARRAVIEEEV